MKAAVIHEYGSASVLKFEDYADPVIKDGHVLIDVVATSVNPIDIGRRSGRMKEIFPINFPGVIGVDVAGTIAKLGAGVSGFSVGDKVFAMADQAYAQRCLVPASSLAKVPAGLDLVESAALPLVTTTGNMLITVGTGIKSGQTVLITGALGSVGRSAVYTAKKAGAVVIVGVLSRQLPQASSLEADQVLAIDDEQLIADLPPVDAVADAVGGKTAALLLGKVKDGGVFASVLGPPSNAKDYPSVRIIPVYAKPDPGILSDMARAVLDARLVIPIYRKQPLSSAAEGHALVESGGIGKVLLLP